MKGKRLIIQMIVGGMTQYLTKVQGMPMSVEQEMKKTIKDYIWDDAKTSPVNADTLHQQIRDGGIKLLDIEARNEAIELTWLRSYLDLTKKRPAWAFIADELIRDCVASVDLNTDYENRTNTFLQDWKVSTHIRSRLPEDLKKMLKVAKKFNANLHAVKVTQKMKRNMPAWYHQGAQQPMRRKMHGPFGECLRTVHGVKTVEDLLSIARRLVDPRHSNRRNCACEACKNDRRNMQCEHPNRCAELAKEITENLQPKWRPDQEPDADGLTLTARRKSHNRWARKNDEKIVFDPSVSTGDALAEGFRVFTDPTRFSCQPAHRVARGAIVPEETTTVYTDGSCINNGDEDAQAGSGVWFGPDDPRNLAVRIPGKTQSNQAAEVYAVQKAVEATAPFAPLHIISDSRYTIDGLTVHLQKWQDRGWIGVANAEHFKAAAYLLRRRSAPTTFEWVKGHEGTQGNEEADRLAGIGARNPEVGEPIMSVPEEWDLTGAKLATLTQALAYKGIMSTKKHTPRRATTAPLDMARHCVKDNLGGGLPTDAAIWKSLRNEDISRNIADFLWRAMHNSHRIGKYWSHIPDYETRETCPNCNTEESMIHILVECDAPGRKQIWDLVERAWTKKGGTWPGVHIGNILGAGLANFKDEGAGKQGLSRLYRIMITESAHLIWKIRCERRIQREDDPEQAHTRAEIERRWTSAMNARIHTDCELTKKKYGSHKLSARIVQATWSGLIKNEKDLPERWADAGFLVGMGPL